MQHFVLCLNPLFYILENKLPGFRVERRGDKTAVVAYADDVIIFLTSSADIPIIQDAIRCYETASGARVNLRKSKAMAIGTWDTNTNIMNVPYYTDVKILGFSIASTVKPSAHNTWSNITGKIRAQARDAHCRGLCLSQ